MQMIVKRPVASVNIYFIGSWTLLDSAHHKELTYVEYSAVSGVFQIIDPPPPTPPSECVLPRTKDGGGGGVHTRRTVRGVGGGSIF
jgi:hypothetical protein